MDPTTLRNMMGAAGAASPAYIEDVFSTWLYTGNGSTQTITNGIDLSGKGGMVWIKTRSAARRHNLVDTARGATYDLSSDFTNAQSTPGDVTGFTSSGFSLGFNTGWANFPDATFSSWTFRKQAKFFDVVTYTGTGSARTVSHNLGSTPGCIIVKRTDTTGDWQVYHRSLANTEYMVLNSTAAKATGTTRWNSTTPTSTVFSLGTDATVNASSGTYVAYLFAHDAGGFGDSGNDSVIKCGSYTGTGSNVFIDLGWEPQWVLTRAVTWTDQWGITDTMRGMPVTGASPVLFPNLSNEEVSWTNLGVTATGFNSGTNQTGNGQTYIYIAIRRGPMKTPTDATKVFAPAFASASSTYTVTAGFPVDLTLYTNTSGTLNKFVFDRLRGTPYLLTTTTDSEASSVGKRDSQTQFIVSASGTWTSYINWMFRRAPGFFDVVAYTGTGSARTVSHNLGVAPELMIVKIRNASGYEWFVYHSFLGNTNYLNLNLTSASSSASTVWNNTSPTTTNFTVGTASAVNLSTNTFIAYLFATCPGVSKVGSYSGSGTTKQIDCGFTAGARFVLIKRTDSTGDWYVWDSARGITAGNDPYLLLNSTAAEVTSTDYIDTLSTGFEITSTAPAAINASGGSFVFLAVA